MRIVGGLRAKLAPDLSALRASRELRLLVVGNFVSGLGTQAALPLPRARRQRLRCGRGRNGPAVRVGLGGAAVAALTTGWLDSARRLGLVTIAAVCVWGLAIAAAGLVGSLWPATALLAVAGAADSVSAVCRSVIDQTVTTDALRGRMSSVFSLVVTSGPRLGDVEAGVVASLASVRTSVVSGGLACVAGALVVTAAFPRRSPPTTSSGRCESDGPSSPSGRAPCASAAPVSDGGRAGRKVVRQHSPKEESMHEDGDESVERLDEDTPQDAAPGAAVDDQGVGQHDDQDVTDVDTKQDHPATPSDMGSR